MLQGRSQSVEVWVQPDQLKQLTSGNAWLDLFIVYLCPLIVFLKHLPVLNTNPLNLLDEFGLRIHHGLLDVPDQGLELPVPPGRLIISFLQFLQEVMPLLTLSFYLFRDYY